MWLLLPWGVCAAAWLVRAQPAERREFAALGAAFVVLPPLLAFAVYFCVCHSVRHLLRSGAMLSPDSARIAWWRGIRVGVPAAMVCIAAAPLLLLHGVQGALTDVFRLLAALTLPHMVVTVMLEEGNRRVLTETSGHNG